MSVLNALAVSFSELAIHHVKLFNLPMGDIIQSSPSKTPPPQVQQCWSLMDPTGCSGHHCASGSTRHIFFDHCNHLTPGPHVIQEPAFTQQAKLITHLLEKAAPKWLSKSIELLCWEDFRELERVGELAQPHIYSLTQEKKFNCFIKTCLN